MIKETPDEHADFELLTNVLNQTKDFLAKINGDERDGGVGRLNTFAPSLSLPPPYTSRNKKLDNIREFIESVSCIVCEEIVKIPTTQ